MKRTLGFLVVLTLLGAATPYIRDYMTVLGSTTSLPASAPAGAFVYVPDAGPVFFNGAQWVKTSNITNNISAPRGTLSLSSDAGVASGDVAVKVGTSSTSVSGVAWPFQVVSGLGSTDSFIFGIRGTNTLVPPPLFKVVRDGDSTTRAATRTSSPLVL